jgi:hypothetical protein
MKSSKSPALVELVERIKARIRAEVIEEVRRELERALARKRRETRGTMARMSGGER